MVKRAFVLAASALLLASGCGSSRHGSVDRPAAQRLAAESDAVAAKLDAGDGCGAAALARKLRHDLAAAAVPLVAQNAAARLAAEIVCVPPAPVQAQPPASVASDQGDEHGNVKAKGHGKHKHGKHGEGD